jgi:hypothetical protein
LGGRRRPVAINTGPSGPPERSLKSPGAVYDAGNGRGCSSPDGHPRFGSHQWFRSPSKDRSLSKVNRHHGRLSPGIRPGRLASSIRRPVVLLLFQRPATRGNLLPKSLQHHSLKLSKIHEPPCSHGVSAPSAHWSEEATNTGLTSPGCAALSGFLNLSVLSSSP